LKEFRQKTQIKVLNGRFQPEDNKMVSPYVVCETKEFVRKTPTILKSRSPIWNYMIRLYI